MEKMVSGSTAERQRPTDSSGSTSFAKTVPSTSALPPPPEHQVLRPGSVVPRRTMSWRFGGKLTSTASSPSGTAGAIPSSARRPEWCCRGFPSRAVSANVSAKALSQRPEVQKATDQDRGDAAKGLC